MDFNTTYNYADESNEGQPSTTITVDGSKALVIKAHNNGKGEGSLVFHLKDGSVAYRVDDNNPGDGKDGEIDSLLDSEYGEGTGEGMREAAVRAAMHLRTMAMISVATGKSMQEVAELAGK